MRLHEPTTPIICVFRLQSKRAGLLAAGTCGRLHVVAPIAQRIERRPPEPGALVRVQLGVLLIPGDAHRTRKACQTKTRIIKIASVASNTLESR